MSAYPAEVLAREGLKDLRVQFLAKPFTRDELLGAVGRTMEAGKPGGRPSSVERRRRES
jgi:hypothetical protein